MIQRKNHKQMHKGRIPAWILLLWLLPAACMEVDTPPSLEVTVSDQFNNPVSGAAVALFADQEQWGMLENPVQVWKLTDEEGKVIFTNLFEQTYYIFAEKEARNNLKNEIKTPVPLMVNQRRLVIIHID